MDKEILQEINKQLENGNIDFRRSFDAEELKCFFKKLQQEQEERENKLQIIEQMFKSGSVDLSELAALVEGK